MRQLGRFPQNRISSKSGTPIVSEKPLVRSRMKPSSSYTTTHTQYSNADFCDGGPCIGIPEQDGTILDWRQFDLGRCSSRANETTILERFSKLHLLW
jgi:hypothetical protein